MKRRHIVVQDTPNSTRTRRRLTSDDLIRMQRSPRPMVVDQAPRVSYAGSLVPLRTGGYRLNNIELKVQDIDTATYQVNTTGSFTLLAIPVLGSDFNARVGRKIILKSFYIKGRVQSEVSTSLAITTVTPQHYRMIVFVDYQPNGAAPAVTDLLVSATPASHLNLNNRDRFKVLADKEWVVDPWLASNTATQSYASTVNQVKFVKKFKRINEECIFNGTNGGSIADITSGALFMFWIGSNAAGTNTDGNAIVATRVRYADA